MIVAIRPVDSADLPLFFAHVQDTGAQWMAAFTPPDPADESGLLAHWERMRADPTIVFRTILADAQVAGNLVAFGIADLRYVGYWLGREFWGRGVATRALRLFLAEIPERPLFARTAFDNRGSQRVLEKCGFRLVAYDTGYSNARGAEIAECLFRLE